MAPRKSLREYTAPDLVRRWRTVVNEHVAIGRDSHLFKEALLRMSPVQILLGMYKNKNHATLTIPMFLRDSESWLELDEAWAEIDLAMYVTGDFPRDYFIYMDYREEETSYAHKVSSEARKSLQEWADQVLS